MKLPGGNPMGKPMGKLGKVKSMGKMHKVMSEMKHGALHSGSKSGPLVKNRKQAIAIGLSEARKAGEYVPPVKTPDKMGRYK